MNPDLFHKLAQQRSRDIEEEIKRIHLSRALGGRRQNVMVWLSRTIGKLLSWIQRPRERKPGQSIKSDDCGAGLMLKKCPKC